MNTKLNKLEMEKNLESSGKKITRKEAIKKTGLMAVSTATMMVLLNNKAEAMGNDFDRKRDRDRDRDGGKGKVYGTEKNGYPGEPKCSGSEPLIP